MDSGSEVSYSELKVGAMAPVVFKTPVGWW
jgi:hypothetical protein